MSDEETPRFGIRPDSHRMLTPAYIKPAQLHDQTTAEEELKEPENDQNEMVPS